MFYSFCSEAAQRRVRTASDKRYWHEFNHFGPRRKTKTASHRFIDSAEPGTRSVSAGMSVSLGEAACSMRRHSAEFTACSEKGSRQTLRGAWSIISLIIANNGIWSNSCSFAFQIQDQPVSKCWVSHRLHIIEADVESARKKRESFSIRGVTSSALGFR